jgi:nitroreductase
METYKAIMTRRSIRQYAPDKIPVNKIKKILKAAMNAPSAGNQQPWHFIVVNERKILDELANIHPHGKMLFNAPCAVIVCGDISLEKHKGYWVQDCSAATQNFLLAAHNLGIGAVWLGVYPREDRITKISNLFNLSSHIIPFCIISMGYPKEKIKQVIRYDPLRVHFNKW